MPANLIKRAIEGSRDREPIVQAMALLTGSRALSASDAAAAREIFTEGAQIAEDLPLDARCRRLFLEEAVRLGAAADPIAAAALFRRLPADERRVWRSGSTGSMVVESLAKRGDMEAALGLFEEMDCDMRGAEAVIQHSPDSAMQRRALAAARELWRRHPEDWRIRHNFWQLFSRHWRKVASAEQESWLDEILRAMEFLPDDRIDARYGEQVELHSRRDMCLFEILNAVRALKSPDVVEAMLSAHPTVAEGVRIYPLGLESLMMQAPATVTASPTGAGFGAGSRNRFSGAPRQDYTNVEHLLAEAHHIFRADIDPGKPNPAPRVFWPSCHAYKLAMYWAGRRSGVDAEPWLAQIPDTDFALLASIDLAAGALHLPHQGGVQIHLPRDFRAA
jgi:pentatricopeptide repeat protein